MVFDVEEQKAKPYIVTKGIFDRIFDATETGYYRIGLALLDTQYYTEKAVLIYKVCLINFQEYTIRQSKGTILFPVPIRKTTIGGIPKHD